MQCHPEGRVRLAHRVHLEVEIPHWLYHPAPNENRKNLRWRPRLGTGTSCRGCAGKWYGEFRGDEKASSARHAAFADPIYPQATRRSERRIAGPAGASRDASAAETIESRLCLESSFETTYSSLSSVARGIYRTAEIGSG